MSLLLVSASASRCGSTQLLCQVFHSFFQTSNRWHPISIRFQHNLICRWMPLPGPPACSWIASGIVVNVTHHGCCCCCCCTVVSLAAELLHTTLNFQLILLCMPFCLYSLTYSHPPTINPSAHLPACLLARSLTPSLTCAQLHLVCSSANLEATYTHDYALSLFRHKQHCVYTSLVDLMHFRLFWV